MGASQGELEILGSSGSIVSVATGKNSFGKGGEEGEGEGGERWGERGGREGGRGGERGIRKKKKRYGREWLIEKKKKRRLEKVEKSDCLV